MDVRHCLSTTTASAAGRGPLASLGFPPARGSGGTLSGFRWDSSAELSTDVETPVETRGNRQVGGVSDPESRGLRRSFRRKGDRARSMSLWADLWKDVWIP